MDKQTQASIDALKRIRGKMQAKRASGHATDGARTSTNSGLDQLSVGAWPEPKPLPNGLAPVEPFSSEFMPGALAPWIDDIANRLQCPPDYVAVSALTALGAVIGRRIGIKPQAKTPGSKFRISGARSSGVRGCSNRPLWARR
jgi:hypothetical protein